MTVTGRGLHFNFTIITINSRKNGNKIKIEVKQTNKTITDRSA